MSFLALATRMFTNFRVPPPLKYNFNLLNLPISEETDGKCASCILGWHTCLQKDCDSNSKGKRIALKEDQKSLKETCWRLSNVGDVSVWIYVQPASGHILQSFVFTLSSKEHDIPFLFKFSLEFTFLYIYPPL